MYTDSWDHHFEWLEMHGDFPYRGDRTHPGWSAARFDPPVRGKDNVREVYAFVGDYDGTAELEEVLATWRGLGAFVHTTRSHTAATPRLRVVVPLARPVTSDEYATVWRAMQKRAAGKLDESTKDAARFWFLPGFKPGGEFQSWRL
jgi:hypothetical protein